jgi:hypothetical protein
MLYVLEAPKTERESRYPPCNSVQQPQLSLGPTTSSDKNTHTGLDLCGLRDYATYTAAPALSQNMRPHTTRTNKS